MSQDRGLAVVAIMWTLVGISSLFIAARLFTRWKILNKIGLDDAIMTCSLVCDLSIFCRGRSGS
jgi:hypothetical protein